MPLSTLSLISSAFLKIVRPFFHSIVMHLRSSLLAPIKSIWDHEAYLRSFLYTFRSFAKPADVMKMLVERFKKPPPFVDCYDIRLRFGIIFVLKKWIAIDRGIDFLKEEMRKYARAFFPCSYSESHRDFHQRGGQRHLRGAPEQADSAAGDGRPPPGGL
jgi:hypothetical protein